MCCIFELERFSNYFTLRLEKEIKGLSNEVVNLSKAAQLGLTQGQVFHDVNNNPTNIFGAANLLIAYSSNDELPRNKIDRFSEMIMVNVKMITNISKRHQDLLYTDRSNCSRLCEVKDCIERSIRDFESIFFRDGISFVNQINENIPIKINDTDFYICISNILNNSIYALKGAKDKRIWITDYIDKKSYSILIHDSGNGIPSELREKIFENQFTTKEKNQGTGLAFQLSVKS